MNSITFLITQSLIKWSANWSYEYDVVTAFVLFFYLRRRRLLTKRSFLYFSIARNIWTNFGVNVSPTFHLSINNPLWRRVDICSIKIGCTLVYFRDKITNVCMFNLRIHHPIVWTEPTAPLRDIIYDYEQPHCTSKKKNHFISKYYHIAGNNVWNFTPFFDWLINNPFSWKDQKICIKCYHKFTELYHIS